MSRNLKLAPQRYTQAETDESASAPVASALPRPPEPGERTWMVHTVIRPDGRCVAVFPWKDATAAQLYASRIGGTVMPYKSGSPADVSRNPPAVPFRTVRPPVATVTVETSTGFRIVHEYDNPADAYLSAVRIAETHHNERGGVLSRVGNGWTVNVKPIKAHTDHTGRRFADRTAFTCTVTVHVS